jgi:hypothetical protein
MTQQWISLLLVGIIMGFLLGGSFARRNKGDKWNMALGVAFAMVGVLSMGNLVILAQKQRQAFQQADAKLACISQVVDAARSSTGYNSIRDTAFLQYLKGETPVDQLRDVLSAPPPPLPACDITWDGVG